MGEAVQAVVYVVILVAAAVFFFAAGVKMGHFDRDSAACVEKCNPRPAVFSGGVCGCAP